MTSIRGLVTNLNLPKRGQNEPRAHWRFLAFWGHFLPQIDLITSQINLKGQFGILHYSISLLNDICVSSCTNTNVYILPIDLCPQEVIEAREVKVWANQSLLTKVCFSRWSSIPGFCVHSGSQIWWIFRISANWPQWRLKMTSEYWSMFGKIGNKPFYHCELIVVI